MMRRIATVRSPGIMRSEGWQLTVGAKVGS